MLNSKTAALGICTCALIGGCRADSVDIGHVGVVGSQLSDYAGSWHGYAEAFQFDDGSDSVGIELDADGNGTIRVGEAGALPAPDAQHIYPPLKSTEQQILKPGGPRDLPVLLSGFDYSVQGAHVESARIRLQAQGNEIYAQWCSLLAPKRVDDNAYNCLGSYQAILVSDGMCEIPMGSSTSPVDCGLASCMVSCACTETKCGASDNGEKVQLDGVLADEGNSFQGTLVLGSTRVIVRLTKS